MARKAKACYCLGGIKPFATYQVITLGARRGQILRQLVCESLLHSLLGAIAGVALATQGLRGLQYALSRVTLPIPGEIALSARVLGATLLISLLAGFLFGLAPGARLQVG